MDIEMNGWPSYGYFPYKGKYFRIYHGKSNKQYSDIPSLNIPILHQALSEAEGKSKDRIEFEEQAKERIKEFNTEIVKVFQIPQNMIKASLCSKYYKGQSPNDGMMGLKITIKWGVFHEFLINSSTSNKGLWKIFSYIYSCKTIFIQRLLEEKHSKFEKNIQRYTEEVNNKASPYLESILKNLDDLEQSIENVISNVIEIITLNSKKENKTPAYTLFTLIYLNELKLKIGSIRVLSNAGNFASCFSEMRRIIEGLPLHMYWDKLNLKTLYRYPKDNTDTILKIFGEGSFKESRNFSSKFLELFEKSDLRKHPLLRELQNLPYYNAEKEKDFINELQKNMSLFSYLIVYGVPLSESPMKKYSEKKLENTELPEISINPDLIELESVEFLDILKRSNLCYPEKEQIADLILKRFGINGRIVLRPFSSPTFPIRALKNSIYPNDLATKLQKLYDEFSAFTHSTWESMTILPFTSVLEIMTFNEWLKQFIDSLNEMLNDFINFFKNQITTFLV